MHAQMHPSANACTGLYLVTAPVVHCIAFQIACTGNARTFVVHAFQCGNKDTLDQKS
jgi:hypothetical protein